MATSNTLSSVDNALADPASCCARRAARACSTSLASSASPTPPRTGCSPRSRPTASSARTRSPAGTRLGEALIALGRAGVAHEELASRARPALQQISADHRRDGAPRRARGHGRPLRRRRRVHPCRPRRGPHRPGPAGPLDLDRQGAPRRARRRRAPPPVPHRSRCRPGPRSRSVPWPSCSPTSSAVVAAGYAVNSGESEDDVVSIAVPVADADGITLASISCAMRRATGSASVTSPASPARCPTSSRRRSTCGGGRPIGPAPATRDDSRPSRRHEVPRPAWSP